MPTQIFSRWFCSANRTKTGEIALWALLLCVTKSSFSLDPHRTFSQYIQTSWATDAGLPQTSVYAVAQTRDGYLWVGTEEGLASFDGEHFRTFNQHNTPALPANYVHRLLGTRDGSLWVGTDSGLTRFDGRTWTTWTAKTGLSSDDIEALAEGPEGSLWVGTGSGLNRIRGGRVEAWSGENKLPNNRILALQVDGAGVLWMGTRAGLASFDGRRFKTYRQPEDWGGRALSALAIAADGSVWCASTEGRLYREWGGRLSAVPVKLPRADILAMLFDHDGNLWLGFSNHGLARLHDGKLTLSEGRDDLPARMTEALFEDAEHNLWVGTFDGGLVQWRDGKFQVWGPAEGLPSAVICCSVETADGTVWAGTEAGEVVKIQPGGTTRTYTRRDGLPGEGIHSMLLGRDGTIWFGHRHGVLTRYRNGGFEHFQSAKSRDHAIDGLLEDSAGRIWMGSYGAGVMRFEDGRFVTVLENLEVSALAQTRDGAIWVGCDGEGVVRLKDGASLRYTDTNGLPSNHVVSLWADPDGTLWVGLISGGLARIGNGQVSFFTAGQGLFDSTAANLMGDDFGNLWMGSDQGVSRVSKQALETFAAGRRSHFHSTGYDTADGLRSRETLQGGTGCGSKGPDGRLWFPTMNGLASIDPRRAMESDPPLRVRIESLQLGARELSPEERIRFWHASDRLNIQFTALTFVAPARVRFRYKLTGYDTNWIEAGDSRVASYTNLPAGRYQFEVQASRYNGEWNSETASIRFAVQPAWYETPSAWLMWVLCACLLTLGIVQARTRRLVKRRRELERLVAERTEQLNQEKSALALAREELQEQATHDSLTGLWNRKAILELLEVEMERAAREGRTLSVAMADLDHFKKVNDTYGHLCGDQVLAEAAHSLQECLRSYDSMGRYGGEEFLILMQGCDPAENSSRFMELLASVGSRHFSNREVEFQITCSLGVTAYSPHGPVASSKELLAAADKALYEAKRKGRNRIEHVEISEVLHPRRHR